MLAKTKNCYLHKIKIPMGLLSETVSLLEELDVENYPPGIIQLYGYVLQTFKEKKASLESQAVYQSMCYCSMNCEEDVPF